MNRHNIPYIQRILITTANVNLSLMIVKHIFILARTFYFCLCVHFCSGNLFKGIIDSVLFPGHETFFPCICIREMYYYCIWFRTPFIPGGPNNPRYIFWYDLKNSAFQYDQRMAKYPFDIRF